jgi:alginate O-acetyltransferase complex protein AlgI
LHHEGLKADGVTLRLVLPIGLSYYVFQNLSYVIDVYRGTVRPTHAAVEYAVALSFFPQLLAGPITRPRDLLPQLLQRREFDQARAADGLRQILWGLTKKMLIADNIGLQVDHVWSNLSSVDGLTLFFAAVLYSIQIYCDFSGYADIAIGTAKLFNLKLSKNFEYPYFSTSLQMFWRRWHMTLSGWMRDYVYISLGGSRVRAWRQAFNVLVTFLLVGLWHGANWTFMVWGLLHGAYMAIETQVRKSRKRRDAPAAGAGLEEAPGVGPAGGRRAGGRLGAVAAAVLVFAVATIAWVFFRAPSLSVAIDFFTRGIEAPFQSGDHLRYLPTLLLSAGFLVYEGLTHRWEHGLAIGRLPLPARWAAYLALCMAVLIFGFLGGREGIYVQF